MVSNGVPIDEVKCFDQLSHLKLFTESRFNDGIVHWFISRPENLKTQEMVSATQKLLKISQFFFAIPPPNVNVQQVSHLCKPSGQRRRIC
jgi:hypothetical protein